MLNEHGLSACVQLHCCCVWIHTRSPERSLWWYWLLIKYKILAAAASSCCAPLFDFIPVHQLCALYLSTMSRAAKRRQHTLARPLVPTGWLWKQQSPASAWASLDQKEQATQPRAERCCCCQLKNTKYAIIYIINQILSFFHTGLRLHKKIQTVNQTVSTTTPDSPVGSCHFSFIFLAKNSLLIWLVWSVS